MTKNSGISDNTTCLCWTVNSFDNCYCGLLTGDAGKVLKKNQLSTEEPARHGCKMILGSFGQISKAKALGVVMPVLT